jgi:hypothetical protein
MTPRSPGWAPTGPASTGRSRRSSSRPPLPTTCLLAASAPSSAAPREAAEVAIRAFRRQGCRRVQREHRRPAAARWPRRRGAHPPRCGPARRRPPPARRGRNDSRTDESLPAWAGSGHRRRVDDVAALIAHNEHFIESWRRGSWECRREILGRDFGYLDGRTGEMWDQNRYVADLPATPSGPWSSTRW